MVGRSCGGWSRVLKIRTITAHLCGKADGEAGSNLGCGSLEGAEGMNEFFAMGGYAVYVWGSYGLAAIVLVGLLLASIQSLRANERTLKALTAALPAQRRKIRSRISQAEETPS